jgi:hypothetical protein
VSPADEPWSPGGPDPPKDKRTGRPDGADRREPEEEDEEEEEEDPGSAFGPESVPLATGSVSVVYWVPGPFPRPTPCPAGSAPQALSALLLCHVGLGSGWMRTPPP